MKKEAKEAMKGEQSTLVSGHYGLSWAFFRGKKKENPDPWKPVAPLLYLAHITHIIPQRIRSLKTQQRRKGRGSTAFAELHFFFFAVAEPPCLIFILIFFDFFRFSIGCTAVEELVWTM